MREKCRICKKSFIIQGELNVDWWWDESGYGYSAKVCKCPRCNTVQFLEVIEDKSLDLNNDLKYYEYTER